MKKIFEKVKANPLFNEIGVRELFGKVLASENCGVLRLNYRKVITTCPSVVRSIHKFHRS